MKKLTTLCLIVAMLASLAACGKGNAGANETTNSADTTADTVAEETSRFVDDELPALDYDGRTATFYIGNYKDAYWKDFYAESSTGERLNDAIYASIQAINERLGVSVTHTDDLYDWPTSDHTNRVTALIMSGDRSFDLYLGGSNFTAQQVTSPYFLNLREVPHVDLTKPWYNQTIPTVLPSDYVWFITGDAGLANIKHTFAVFFNQELMEANGIDSDLYSMVDAGTWTLDALKAIAEQGYVDANGDGAKDAGDSYGLTFGDMNKLLGFRPAFDVDILERSDTGYSVVFGSERAVNVVERLCALCNDTQSVAPTFGNNDDHPEWQTSSGGGNYVSNAFIEQRALMSCSLIGDATTIMPEIDFTCGIVPYPKYDEAQKEYKSYLQRSCYTLIPSFADAEFSGALLEAWSSQAYRAIMPEYFEVALKTRYAQDSDSARMFDLIRGSISYDAGEIFGIYIDTPSAKFREAIMSNQPNWASLIQSNQTKWQTALDEMWATFTANE